MLVNDYDKTSALVRLAASVSHELNNILMVIDGNLSFACEQGAFPEAVREMMTESLVAARRGIDLSKNLQAFAGRQPLQPVIVDLRRTVYAAMQVAQQEFAGTAIHLDLPHYACNTRLDPSHAKAALLELMRNAHAAMAADGVIKIEMVRAGPGSSQDKAGSPHPSEAIRLTVIDNGSGLAPEALARATEPMFTLKKGAGARVGWGLSLVEGFVRQSGGTMSLSGAIGEGLRVDIYLPPAPISDQALPPSRPAP